MFSWVGGLVGHGYISGLDGVQNPRNRKYGSWAFQNARGKYLTPSEFGERVDQSQTKVKKMFFFSDRNRRGRACNWYDRMIVSLSNDVIL